jgi:hypothetical protein
MVVDGFDPNPERSHRSDEPIRPAVIRVPLLVVRAYRLLDIEALKSTLGQSQQRVVRPDERLDRHGLSNRSSRMQSLRTSSALPRQPSAPPDRMPTTRCHSTSQTSGRDLGTTKRQSCHYRRKPVPIEVRSPRLPPANFAAPVGDSAFSAHARPTPPEREVASSNLAGRAPRDPLAGASLTANVRTNCATRVPDLASPRRRSSVFKALRFDHDAIGSVN